MPVSGNQRAVMTARREQVASLYLRGMSQQTIAVDLDIGQATVSRDLSALQKAWQASALVDVDEAKARELARIDELERTYWLEWEASKHDKEATATKKVKAGEGSERLEATVRKEQRLGDPRYLAGVQWCITRRCEIMGIDAPKRSEWGGKDGTPIPIAIVKMDMDEL